MKRTNNLAYRALVTILAAATCAVVAGRAEAEEDVREQIIALRQDKREAVMSESLVVNPDSTIRYVYQSKCQEEGEAELIQLTASAVLEESYVYIPDLCVWIELGHNETGISVSFDKALLDKIINQYYSAIIYHLHPGHRANVESYFPAYQDFITLVLINSEHMADPHIDIRHRVITEYAIIDYRFRNQENAKLLIDKYTSMGLHKYAGQNLAYEYARKAYVESYIKNVKKCAEFVDYVPANISECHQIVTDVFIIDIRAVNSVTQ